ncbi:hypothetical protein HPB49_006050 [Dermacentor silvarum]|uniref:Uncharacterized protein n=1 Tax=Dermacentor silvarum TaxID=543639 RepID=A0ACB8DAP1_DERSI|nr:hypothetical protein HPB49_006050 [Dermacentor silvarum]
MPKHSPDPEPYRAYKSKQNIAVVSTSSEDMAASIRDINTASRRQAVCSRSIYRTTGEFSSWSGPWHPSGNDGRGAHARAVCTQKTNSTSADARAMCDRIDNFRG